MLHQHFSIEELNAYQRLQMKHDEIYHHDIVVLGVHRRMNHITLHLAKYLSSLLCLPTTNPNNRRVFIDSFIMVVSAGNLLGISFVKEFEIQYENSINEPFINQYSQLLSELAKACEATDHQEDYPIRTTWNKTIRKFFILLVNEAIVRNISILDEASKRLYVIEQKHPLNCIFREVE